MRLRAIVTIVAASLGALLLAPVARAAQPALLYPPTSCPLLSVSTTHPLPGEAITVAGQNFTPDASVRLELHSKIYVLETVTTDNTGSFTTTVKLPAGVTGTHQIVAATGAPHIAGCPPNPVVTIHIQGHGAAGAGAGAGGSGSSGGTSFTGVDILLIVIIAALLLGVGFGLTQAGRRSKHVSNHPLID